MPLQINQFLAPWQHDVPKQPNKRDVPAEVSIVYVTMEPTFTGRVAGYSTATEGAEQTAARSSRATSTRTPSTRQADDATTSTRSSSRKSATTSSESTSPATRSSSASPESDQSAVVGLMPATATPSASPTSVSAEQSSGIGGGAIAGIAIGLIVAFALIAGVVLILFKRKKSSRQAAERIDDEKSFVASPRPDTQARPPRLSLGPNMLSGFADPKPQPTISPSPSETRLTVFPPSSVAHASVSNPFGTSPELNEKAAASGLVGNGPQQDPFADSNASPSPTQSSSPEPGAGAVVGSKRGMPGNVHRVQLNFQPTMNDELELKAGQVVRVMHEYDDGWVLCMRMDRSQQGVAPRTCLSKLPIKPRQANPPPLRPSGQQAPIQQRKTSPQLTSSDPMYPAPLSPSNSLSNLKIATATAAPPPPHNPRPRSMSQSQSPQDQTQSPLSTSPTSSLLSSSSSHGQEDHRRSMSVGQTTATTTAGDASRSSPQTSPQLGRPLRKAVGSAQ